MEPLDAWYQRVDGATREEYEEYENENNKYSGEILYEGLPVAWYMYCEADEVKRDLGTPYFEGYGQADYCLEYDSLGFYLYDEDDVVTYIHSWDPSALTLDGDDLMQDRSGLVSILDTPDYEDWVEVL